MRDMQESVFLHRVVTDDEKIRIYDNPNDGNHMTMI